MTTPNLDRFIATKGDDERLALGAEVLRAAWEEARTTHLQGWVEEVYVYLYAVESGKGLNDPFASNQESKQEGS